MKIYTLAFIVCFIPSTICAQMFSVRNVENKPSESNTYLRIGAGVSNFSYSGTSTSILPVNRLDFDNNSLSIQFESNVLELGVNFANSLVKLEDQTFLNFYLYYNNSILFSKNKSFQFGIPLRIGTDLVSVTKEGSRDKFSQNSLSVGAGLLLSLRIKDKIIFSNKFIPNYGFSSSSGGFFGGSNFSLTGKSRLNFINLIGNKNLSVGYDYKNSSYNITDHNFDYDLKAHLITIAISL